MTLPPLGHGYVEIRACHYHITFRWYDKDENAVCVRFSVSEGLFKLLEYGDKVPISYQLIKKHPDNAHIAQ